MDLTQRQAANNPIAGYTLLETLVAMSLFLSVLLPLGVSIGNLLFDHRAERIHQALEIAEAEMAAAVVDSILSERVVDIEPGLRLQRRVHRNELTVEIEVEVVDRGKSERKLVFLSRTIVF
jgi:hypothetical protein